MPGTKWVKVGISYRQKMIKKELILRKFVSYGSVYLKSIIESESCEPVIFYKAKLRKMLHHALFMKSTNPEFKTNIKGR